MAGRIAMFTLLVAVGGGEVSVRRGEKLSLSLAALEPKMVSLRKVHGKEVREVFCYCSPEEQSRGCRPSDSGRFSHRVGEEDFSITFLDAHTSDSGLYELQIIDGKNEGKSYSVTLTEQQLRSINPEPPPIRAFTPPATSTKAEEIFGIDDLTTPFGTKRNRKITGGIVGGLSVIVAVVVIGIICHKQQVHRPDGSFEVL